MVLPNSGGLGTQADLRTTSDSPHSAVAWPAIIGGAVLATIVTVILLTLGAAFGVASVSPYLGNNPSGVTFTVIGGIWLIVMQWLSSAFGGYLTGRLRTKWAGLHTHEVFFRDTANGLLSWAVASLLIVSLVASGATALIGTGVKAAGAAATVAARSAAPTGEQSGYALDALLRPTKPDATAPAAETRAEAARIVASSAGGSISPDDRTYLAQIVAMRAGISQQDAEARVDDLVGKEKAAADKAKQVANAARKSTSAIMLFTAISMLVGALMACVGAAIGGQQRDLH